MKSTYLFLLVFFAMVGKCSAQDSTVDRPKFSVGDYWQYSFENRRYRKPGCEYDLTVERIANDSIYSRLNFPRECEVSVTSTYPAIPGSLHRFDLDFNHFSFSKTSYKAFPFPLTVGKTWSQKYQRKINGWVYNDELTGKIDGWETITTPAGTFKTLRISLKVSYLGEKPGRIIESGIVEDTFWYSPEVRNFVRREYDAGRWALIVRELQNYRLHE